MCYYDDMNVTALIAEFNPFHNGHEYILSHAKSRTDADFILVIMSGSFVQRGEPACMYKYDRVLAALKAGSDLVLELPVSYSTASAETFAFGGVSLADSLNVCGTLIFGAETDDTKLLSDIAGKLADPDDEILSLIQAGLKQGLSYPAARAAALNDDSGILSSPNNILAVEYIKALNALDSKIRPFAIKRIGSGYNESTPDKMPSALFLRNSLYETKNDVISDAVSDYMPSYACGILSDAYGKTAPIFIEDMLPYLDHAILSADKESMSGLQDMNSDLANRFINSYNALQDESRKRGSAFTIAEYLKSMRTKEVTYSRLSRALLHCILNLKDLTRGENGDLIPCPYARILGFRKQSSGLLQEMSEKSSIPMINKPADAKKLLDRHAFDIFEASATADRIYDSIIKNKYGTVLNDTYRTSPLII